MSGIIDDFLRRRRNCAIKVDDSDASTEDTMAKTKTAHPGAPPKGAFRGGEKPKKNKIWFQIDPLKQSRRREVEGWR